MTNQTPQVTGIVVDVSRNTLALDLDRAEGEVPPDLARCRSRLRLLSRAGPR